MNDNLRVGQEVEVMIPQGTFTLDLDHGAMRDYYLFAGGSGITPMMSLIKTILEEEPKSSVHLFYGNQDCLLYTSPSPRDKRQSRMPSSA